MLKELIKILIKFTIEIVLCLLILTYLSAIILVKGNQEHWKIILAHTTGAGVQIVMGITFLYSCFNFIPYHYRNKYSVYAIFLLLLGIISMLLGYNLFIFEGLSPYVHAQVNILFDAATILLVLSILVDKISVKKFIKRGNK